MALAQRLALRIHSNRSPFLRDILSQRRDKARRAKHHSSAKQTHTKTHIQRSRVLINYSQFPSAIGCENVIIDYAVKGLTSLYCFYAHVHETTPTSVYKLSHTHIVIEEGPWKALAVFPLVCTFLPSPEVLNSCWYLGVFLFVSLCDWRVVVGGRRFGWSWLGPGLFKQFFITLVSYLSLSMS